MGKKEGKERKFHETLKKEERIMRKKEGVTGDILGILREKERERERKKESKREREITRISDKT